MSLAKKVCSSCKLCNVRTKIVAEQRMGDLPVERIGLEIPPWTNVCVDLMQSLLMGPTKVKAMVNSRATMKCWPIVVCTIMEQRHSCFSGQDLLLLEGIQG